MVMSEIDPALIEEMIRAINKQAALLRELKDRVEALENEGHGREVVTSMAKPAPPVFANLKQTEIGAVQQGTTVCRDGVLIMHQGSGRRRWRSQANRRFIETNCAKARLRSNAKGSRLGGPKAQTISPSKNAGCRSEACSRAGRWGD